jgi:hypothetical protein
MSMKTTKIPRVVPTMLCFSLACLAWQAPAQSTTVDKNTFQMQVHSTMKATGALGAAQGLASSGYTWLAGIVSQTLTISCKGLVTNQVYHLMASFGTNGELIHVSDFMPNRSGTILMQHLAGGSHHFTGTDDPGQVWGANGGWSNHMSWVIFPMMSGTNWCDAMDGAGDGPHAMDVVEGLNDPGVTSNPPQADDARAQGIADEDGHYAAMGGGAGMGGGTAGMGGGPGMAGGTGLDGTGGLPGMGNGTGMGGISGMGDAWPALNNWYSGTSNWVSDMADWCWDYTNLWNSAAQYGGVSTNWWGHLGSSASHMMPMPPTIDGVPAINGLVVMDGRLQTVLSADMANPDTFTYHTQHDLTNSGIITHAKGTVQVSATQHSVTFALSATGLAPRTTYFLALNGGAMTSCTADANGRLQIRRLPGGMNSIKGIGNVSILDRNHDVLLSAALGPG